MGEYRIAAGLWCLGQTSDRFCPGGYSDEVSVREMIRRAGDVEGIDGVELHWDTDFVDLSFAQMRDLLKEHNLVCSNMNLNTFGYRKWKHGAFTSRDPQLRKEALELAAGAVTAAREMGCGVGLWLGADGYDYPFQADYRQQWGLTVEGVRTVAQVDPTIDIGIEYKLKEPRTHMQIGSVAKALYVCHDVGLDNVGVALDFGHALMSRENPADSLCLLARSGKLFNVHFNDAYREWDDDMIPGTVNLWETIEYLYYLEVTDYRRWIGLDMFPYREDPVEACQMAVDNIKAMMKLADAIDRDSLEEAQRGMDAVATQKVVRRVVFGD